MSGYIEDEERRTCEECGYPVDPPRPNRSKLDLHLCNICFWKKQSEKFSAQLDQLKAQLAKLSPDMKHWSYYPILIPLDKDGNGPITIGKEIDRITYEVWDYLGASYGTYEYLSDAINRAIQLTIDNG